MRRGARVSLLLLVAALLAGAPLYLALDAQNFLPPQLRDRPWPTALLSCALALWALRFARLSSARRVLVPLCLVVALASPAGAGWTARDRYALPPASPSAGVGQTLPALSLVDESGSAVHLASLRGPTVLVWFRGAWCPYCKKQLAELSRALAHFPAAGVRVLAVTVDPPDTLAKLKQELALPFSLLSDPTRALMSRCELAHCVAITDGDGVIRWGVVSGSWRDDLRAESILEAAYRER